MYSPTKVAVMSDEAEGRLDVLGSNMDGISAKDYDYGLDYVDDKPLVILHHNLYHLTLESKLKVFFLLFMIIVIPATIVFVICYLRDRKRQRRHERHVAALLLESPDPSLPYTARLSRPVPVGVSDNRSEEPISERPSKTRKVSFANDGAHPDERRSTMSNSKLPSVVFDPPEIGEDDVFNEVEEPNEIERKSQLPRGHSISETVNFTSNNNMDTGKAEKDEKRSEMTGIQIEDRELKFNSCNF